MTTTRNGVAGWFLVALMKGVCIRHAEDATAARALAGGRGGEVIPIHSDYPPLYGLLYCTVCGETIPPSE